MRSQRRSPRRPTARSSPDSSVWNKPVHKLPSTQAVCRDRKDDRREPVRPRRFRLRPLAGKPDRDPDHSRPRLTGDDPGGFRLCRRERWRAISDPCECPHRRRLRPSRADRRPRPLPPLRAHALERRGGRWHAGSGAIWNLRSNKLRAAGWTSADAAGLPILPGLARYDEVARGRIDHALRFTVRTHAAGVRLPGETLRERRVRSLAAADGPALPAQGARTRQPASRPRLASSSPALKRYGMIVADNGSSWYVTGAPDPRWSTTSCTRCTVCRARTFGSWTPRSFGRSYPRPASSPRG